MIWNDYTPDYIAIIATQAALAAQVEQVAPAPPKPPLPNCPQCKGTGQIRTGDNQGWTACPCTERVATGGSNQCPNGLCPQPRR